MSNKLINCKYFIFHCFILFLAVNSQHENQPMKEDDGRIWVELEMERPTKKTMPPEIANQMMESVQKECRGNNANANLNGTNTECSIVECPFPFEEAEDEDQNLAWLFPIPFRRGEDPRQCNQQKEVDPNEVFLEFEFCHRPNDEIGSGTSHMDCLGFGYLICYEGQLDPSRAEEIFSLKNANTTGGLIKLCNEPTPAENFGKIGGLAQGLAKWENNQGIGPKHGFLIGQQAALDGFGFRATFLPIGQIHASPKCLRIRIFNEPHKFPIAKITIHNANGNEIIYPSLENDAKIPENITERIANGEPLNGEELLGYWLLGMDMFANFRPNEPFNLKIVKKGNGKCVPTAVVRSTHFAVPNKSLPTRSAEIVGGSGETNKIEMEQWELANADTVFAQFGGRVKFNDDLSVVVNYGDGEDWLNLTFAVPSADSFMFKQQMISVAEEQNQADEDDDDDDDEDAEEMGKCWKGGSEYQNWEANTLLFEYNQLGANCQIILGRTELISHLEMPSADIVEEIDDLEVNEAANIGIDNITLKYFNNEKIEKQIKMECAVKNKPIEEFTEYPTIPGVSQQYIFQINFLPSSLNKFGKPGCKDSLQIIFDSQYDLLLPKKAN